MSLIVGAYPAEPADAAERSLFYAALAENPMIRGLELPYRIDGGAPWPAEAPSHWQAVVTAIPGTMQRAGADATFGLASNHEPGRQAAVDFTATIREYVAELRLTGVEVAAVAMHSAPRHGGTPAAFEKSLLELASWDWCGAKLVIEHCDADSTTHTPEKGFMTLETEIQVVHAVRSAGHDIGVVVNWGRSVIETRDPATARQHIELAGTHGVLAGVMFSGCAAEPTSYGYAWIDAHLPPIELDTPSGSLLTAHDVIACTNAAATAGNDALISGFKIAVPPSAKTALERAAVVRSMCELMLAALV